jgi:hypothetical protein
MPRKLADLIFGFLLGTSVIEAFRENIGAVITLLAIAILIKLVTQGEP